MSSTVGASLIDPQKLYFGIIGDLAFFYDLNSLGNRHISNNLRILLVNNGIGAEFKLYCYPGARLEDDCSPYIAAQGHFGNKSHKLVKHYAQDLGFEYLCASNKDEFNNASKHFLNPEITDHPILLEIFTKDEDESTALEIIRNLDSNALGMLKKIAKGIFGDNTKQTIRRILGQ